MATYRLSLNMEYCRSADMSFKEGIRKASDLGYTHVEPMVHTGWDLLSEVGYFHSFSMEQDPLWMKEICDRNDVSVSSLSGHSPLMKPEAAVDRLTRAIIFADYLGTDVVNTDEMLQSEWMDEDDAMEAMSYTMKKMVQVAERHEVYLCVEPHGEYTKTADGLMEIVNLVDSPWVQVNWDTGNAYLAGIENPYEGLRQVRDHVYHVHAKDISMEQSEDERGDVTGTPVGCACGEGMVDWEQVLEILDPLDREITFSVECGTIEQAKNSHAFLTDCLGDDLVEDQQP